MKAILFGDSLLSDMLLTDIKSIPISHIEEPFFKSHIVSLSLLRLEQTDQTISGNKWFKLLYNLEKVKQENYTALLTFGGAYSNHIHATAEACHRFGIDSIGIIRGEEHSKLNQTLSEAKANKMRLYYISREQYRQRHEPEFIKQLLKQLHAQDYIASPETCYVLPEGGTNKLAIQGCALIPGLIPINYDYLCCPIGSGGTFSGLIEGVNQEKENNAKLLGFSALKGAKQLEQSIQQLINQEPAISNTPNWSINHDYHFGGFARTSPELLSFINDFYLNHGIKLDIIYTGKMLFGIYQLIKNNYFPPESNIVAIHTGGLQGNYSFEEKGLLFQS